MVWEFLHTFMESAAIQPNFGCKEKTNCLLSLARRRAR